MPDFDVIVVGAGNAAMAAAVSAREQAMLDYTVDDASGAVVDGSRTAPQDIEDFWTFMRPVGNNPWKLSAIQTT